MKDVVDPEVPNGNLDNLTKDEVQLAENIQVVVTGNRGRNCGGVLYYH